jgi:uncharacterized protein YqjF (DUF2071 family)
MTPGNGPAVTSHRWDDAVFLSWRVDPLRAERLLPRGLAPAVRPDVVDGSAWVVLSAYVFRATRVPPLPPVPGRLGTLTEVTVEVLTADRTGNHGTAYRTIETPHLPAVLAARIGLGIPYRAARVGFRRRGDVLAYRVARPREDTLTLALRVHASDGAVTSTDRTIANRAGIHAPRYGRSWWIRTHDPLTLRPAVIEELRGDLPDRVGVPGLLDTPPDSALVADPVDVTYSWGGRIR